MGVRGLAEQARGLDTWTLATFVLGAGGGWLWTPEDCWGFQAASLALCSVGDPVSREEGRGQ